MVYRARDERLGHEVAVKVLHAGALADPDSRRRFRREALALSRLEHPAIAALYDFDSDQGIDFIVMELVPGVSLARRLQEGPLAEEELVKIAVDVAGALGAAHDEGIVHRDLKPSNILLTDGGLKVVDFGLAKLDSTQSREMSERLSSLMPAGGTPHYMAPEQVLGRDVDARTDLYALGCVMYEMASGRVPFSSDVPALLCQQILRERPEPIRSKGRRPAPRLECIILKLLQKRPGHRFPSAAALLQEMRGWSVPLGPSSILRLELARRGPGRLVGVSCLGVALVGGGLFAADPEGMRQRIGLGPTPIRSLAVLPFANLSPDPNQEFLVDGLTEDVIAELARGGSLKVISRTSVLRYKDARKTVPEIGRELSVDAVVQGSVARHDDQVRLTAQLIDTRTEHQLWGESFDRTVADLPSLRTEVPLAITNAVRARRPSDRRDRSPPILKAGVYDNLLKGRYYKERGHEPDLTRALTYFEEAIRLQPDCAEAHASKADVYLSLSLVNVIPEAEAYPQARASARRAVECDPGSDYAHAMLGRILHIIDWKFDEALVHLKRALDINPGSPRTLRAYGTHLATMGRVEELVAVTRRAFELDPVSVGACQSYTYALKAAGRLDEAIAMAFRALELDSTHLAIRLELAEAYWAMGRRRESCEQVLRFYSDLPIDPVQLEALRAALARGGPEAFWRQELAKNGFDFVNPVMIASIYTYLGNPDSAMIFLDRAYAKRYQALLYIKTTPDLWPLQVDPRFQALLSRMGIPPEPLPFVRRMLAQPLPPRSQRGTASAARRG